MTKYHRIKKTDAEDATEPVNINEAKEWLKVDYTDDDTVITRMIKSARQSLEKYCNLALVKSDVVVVADSNKYGMIRLPFTDSIEEVEIKDNEDAVVETDNYTIRGDAVFMLPQNTYQYHTITYSIDPDEVPEALKEAILMEVAQRYRDRGENAEGSGLSKAAMEKADPYKIIWI